jgi:hypothetical protein
LGNLVEGIGSLLGERAGSRQITPFIFVNFFAAGVHDRARAAVIWIPGREVKPDEILSSRF